MHVLLNMISVLDVIESQVAWQVDPQVVHHRVSMYALAATDQIEAGSIVSHAVRGLPCAQHFQCCISGSLTWERKQNIIEPMLQDIAQKQERSEGCHVLGS